MKDFLLICDKNCATYKEVFPLFKQGIVSFGSPVKEYEGTDKKFGNHSWITTFPVPNKKKLVLTATYDPALYPKYDNYDAIEVSRIKNIPYDYDGVMGVPITILDYDLDNVEVLKCLNDNTPDTRTPTINGKEKYTRILIKKNFEIKGMAAGNSAVNGFGSQAGYRKHKKDRGGCPVLDDERIYTRILIKKNFEIDGCLYGDHTIIDGTYIKGHTPEIEGKHKYVRILIKTTSTRRSKTNSHPGK